MAVREKNMQYYHILHNGDNDDLKGLDDWDVEGEAEEGDGGGGHVKPAEGLEDKKKEIHVFINDNEHQNAANFKSSAAASLLIPKVQTKSTHVTIARGKRRRPCRYILGFTILAIAAVGFFLAGYFVHSYQDHQERRNRWRREEWEKIHARSDARRENNERTEAFIDYLKDRRHRHNRENEALPEALHENKAITEFFSDSFQMNSKEQMQKKNEIEKEIIDIKNGNINAAYGPGEDETIDADINVANTSYGNDESKGGDDDDSVYDEEYDDLVNDDVDHNDGDDLTITLSDELQRMRKKWEEYHAAKEYEEKLREIEALNERYLEIERHRLENRDNDEVNIPGDKALIHEPMVDDDTNTDTVEIQSTDSDEEINDMFNNEGNIEYINDIGELNEIKDGNSQTFDRSENKEPIVNGENETQRESGTTKAVGIDQKNTEENEAKLEAIRG